MLSYLDGRRYALQLSNDGQAGLSHFRRRLSKLGAAGGFNPAAETLIAGCGFGWLVEVIKDVGSNAVWGAEISTAIWAAMDAANVRPDVRPLLLNIDILAVNAAALFKAAGAGTNQGRFRNVVTEHMVEDWPIGSINTLLDACDALRAPGQSQVYHIVTAMDGIQVTPENPDPAIVPNRLTLAQWKSTSSARPGHYWVDEVMGAVL
jgi:hypothetical protein